MLQQIFDRLKAIFVMVAWFAICIWWKVAAIRDVLYREGEPE